MSALLPSSPFTISLSASNETGTRALHQTSDADGRQVAIMGAHQYSPTGPGDLWKGIYNPVSEAYTMEQNSTGDHMSTSSQNGSITAKPVDDFTNVVFWEVWKSSTSSNGGLRFSPVMAGDHGVKFCMTKGADFTTSDGVRANRLISKPCEYPDGVKETSQDFIVNAVAASGKPSSSASATGSGSLSAISSASASASLSAGGLVVTTSTSTSTNYFDGFTSSSIASATSSTGPLAVSGVSVSSSGGGLSVSSGGLSASSSGLTSSTASATSPVSLAVSSPTGGFLSLSNSGLPSFSSGSPSSSSGSSSSSSGSSSSSSSFKFRSISASASLSTTSTMTSVSGFITNM